MNMEFLTREEYEKLYPLMSRADLKVLQREIDDIRTKILHHFTSLVMREDANEHKEERDLTEYAMKTLQEASLALKDLAEENFIEEFDLYAGWDEEED
jgi:hypothetical protein